MKGRLGIGESGFDSSHPKYINCELCTLAIIIYTINKIHLVAKQHLSLILDLSGGIWPLDLRNFKFHPACRMWLGGPGRSNLLFLPCTYLPPLAWTSSSCPHLWHKPSSPGHSLSLTNLRWSTVQASVGSPMHRGPTSGAASPQPNVDSHLVTYQRRSFPL